MKFFGCNSLNAVPLKCASMNSQECKIRSEIIDVNRNVPTFYLHSIEVNKCSGSWNNINDRYAKLCVPDVVKNINAKVFNLMLRTNETRHLKWHETCKRKCRLDASVSNNKQRGNSDKCRCERKELIDNGRCDKGIIWNPSNCKCEYDKLYNVGEYLDYKSCKCRKRLTDKLVEECGEIIDGNEMLYNSTLNDYWKIYNSCTVYIILLTIFFVISISISSVFIYFHSYLKRRYTETPIY